MRTTKRQSLGASSNDFRSFLSKLEEEGELIKVKKNVSARFELAAIVSKFEGKQAVLFEKVEGSKLMVACNVLGTRKRFCLAIGAKEEKQIHAQLVSSIAKSFPPKKLLDYALFYENYSNDLMSL